MKKRTSAVVAVAISIAGAASAQEVIRIGHVAAVTGPVAYFGKDTENGARLAIDALNARPVVIAGKKVRFELMAEDDAGEPRQATTVAQKLVDAKVNGVVGHQTSGTTIPASKIYYTAGIPQISHSSTSPKYTQQGFNTTFRVVANDTQLGRALGRYAVKSMAVRRVAVIDDRTAYGQGLATEFTKGLQQQGGSVVAREFTNDKATDFNAILTKIRATKPDLVFFGGMNAVAGPMLRQMKQLGMATRMMGGDGICSDEIDKLSGGAMADGQVVCAEAGGVDVQARRRWTIFGPSTGSVSASTCRSMHRTRTTRSWCWPTRWCGPARALRPSTCPRWRRPATKVSPARSPSTSTATSATAR